MTRVSLTKDEIIYFLFNSSIMQSNICKKNVHVQKIIRFFKGREHSIPQGKR